MQWTKVNNSPEQWKGEGSQAKKKQHYWRGPTSCPTETGYKNPEVCGNGQEGSSGAQMPNRVNWR